MKSTRAGLAAVIVAIAATPVYASLELAHKSACTACHAVDRKLVGPAFQEIAKRYAGQDGAAARLAASIRQGGAGKWGPVPMPPQPNLGEPDAKALAQWVLGGTN